MNEPGEAAGTSVAAPNDTHGGSSVDGQDGPHPNPQFKEAEASSFPKNELALGELALGDALDVVPGDAESVEASKEKQQPSASLVDEELQAKDGAYDATTPSKWNSWGWKWQVSHLRSFVGPLGVRA